jgi:surfactin synthase thioesterase subunit
VRPPELLVVRVRRRGQPARCHREHQDQAPHRSIEDMASHYLEALQTVQSEPPYLLGGWSLGGLIAFEMAQQLRKAGDEVGLLALIDPTTVRNAGQQLISELGNGRSNRSLSERFESRILRHLRHLQKLPSGTRLPYFRERFGIMLSLLKTPRFCIGGELHGSQDRKGDDGSGGKTSSRNRKSAA